MNSQASSSLRRRTIAKAPARAASGFTLIEVMTALAIFSLIGVACYQLLNSVTRSRSMQAQHVQYRQQLERTLLVFEQDLLHLLPRSVRAEGSEQRLAALSNQPENRLELSRGGLPVTGSLWLDGPARVIYRLEDGDAEGSGGAVLYRTVYRVLDRLEASDHYRQRLLPGVNELRFRFMRSGGGWVSRWPASGGDSQAPELDRLPAAVELVLRLSDEREITRIYSLR